MGLTSPQCEAHNGGVNGRDGFPTSPEAPVAAASQAVLQDLLFTPTRATGASSCMSSQLPASPYPQRVTFLHLRLFGAGYWALMAFTGFNRREGAPSVRALSGPRAARLARRKT